MRAALQSNPADLDRLRDVLDRDYEVLRAGMRTLFHDLAINTM